jgi:hypothetical protein
MSNHIFLLVVLVSLSDALHIQKLKVNNTLYSEMTQKMLSVNENAQEQLAIAAPGEILPQGTYSECPGDAEVLSHCSFGSYESCAGGGSSIPVIFQQSWNMEGEVDIFGNPQTVLTYLRCGWTGGADDGMCDPMDTSDSLNFCFMRITPEIPAPGTSPSGSPSTSPEASITPSRSDTPSISVTPMPSTSATTPSLSSSMSATSSPSPSMSFGSSQSSSSAPSMTARNPNFCWDSAVEGYNLVPVIVRDIPEMLAHSGREFEYDLDGFWCDPEQATLSYHAVGNLPEGFTIDGSMMKGIFETPGSYQVQVYAMDDNPAQIPAPATTFWIHVI